MLSTFFRVASRFRHGSRREEETSREFASSQRFSRKGGSARDRQRGAFALFTAEITLSSRGNDEEPSRVVANEPVDISVLTASNSLWDW